MDWDRGNQFTLGVLLGTFVYALVVLRSVRGGDGEFVPSLGVTVGLALSGVEAAADKFLTTAAHTTREPEVSRLDLRD